MTTLVLLTMLVAGAGEAPDTIVVGPRDFLPALQPWVAHRTAQGHRIGFVSNMHSAVEIRAAVRESAQSGQLKWLVLLGDADPAAANDPAVRARCTPTHHAVAKINVKWGSEPEIATDNWFADLDDDHVPDIAVGRLTADSAAELSTIVRKILAYEQGSNQGNWRQRVSFVAGVGGFGPLVDTVLETATKKFLTDGIPSSYATTMTYGSWRSPYCPDPRRFHDASVRRLNEGCLFWVYIGHGQRTHVDRVKVPGGSFHILGTGDMAKLRTESGSPIAIFLACYTGAFDQPSDCLAEEMLRTESGPVAVLCGSRVTMPYAMAVLGTAMMDECFNKRRETLGEVMLFAKRRLVAEEPNNFNRQMLDAVAAAISPAPDKLAEERNEHLDLFNLIGDPLLRLRHPQDITLRAIEDADAGERLEIAGECPVPGRCTIELVCRRDQLKSPPAARDQFVPTDAALVQFNEVYEQANDRCWARHIITLDGGEFRAQLDVPADAHGACHVKVFVEGKHQHAVGATDVFIRRAAAATGK